MALGHWRHLFHPAGGKARGQGRAGRLRQEFPTGLAPRIQGPQVSPSYSTTTGGFPKHQNSTTLHCTALHCTALHCTVDVDIDPFQGQV
jgi:hypothetical protein